MHAVRNVSSHTVFTQRHWSRKSDPDATAFVLDAYRACFAHDFLAKADVYASMGGGIACGDLYRCFAD